MTTIRDNYLMAAKGGKPYWVPSFTDDCNMFFPDYWFWEDPETGTDFFNIRNLKDYDAVVSNPPFSKRQGILKRLFEADVPFAMILNFNGLFDSKTRWKLFKENDFELLIPLGRIHFFNEGCNGNSPNFQSIYVCKGMLKKQIEFAESTEMRQMSIFDFIERTTT